MGHAFGRIPALDGPDITPASDRGAQPGKVYHYRVYAVRPTPRGLSGTGVSNVITVRFPKR